MAKYDYFKLKNISFLGRWIHRSVIDTTFNIIKNEVESGGTILEIGPGIGGLAKKLTESGFSYFCFDRSETLVEYLKNIGIDARHENVPPLQCENNSIDCVVHINVLEHMADSEEALALLNEINRVLKKDGRMVMRAPNCSGWGLDFYEVDYTHSFVVSVERIRQLFSDTNFQILSIKNSYGCLFGFIGFVFDKLNNLLFSVLHQIFPMNSKIIKGKILFHPLLQIVANKSDIMD